MPLTTTPILALYPKHFKAEQVGENADDTSCS